jgi:hypothetical protein
MLRLEGQSLPRSRHVDENGLDPGALLAIGHLPTFGGTLPALCGADHRTCPLVPFDPTPETSNVCPVTDVPTLISADRGNFATPATGRQACVADSESLSRLSPHTDLSRASRSPRRSFSSGPRPCEQPCAGCRSVPDPDLSSRSRSGRRLHPRMQWGRWQPLRMGVGDGNAALS